MADFERTRVMVAGRSVILTSWFDEGKKTWHASAPGYTHVTAVFARGDAVCASRQAAISRLSHLLATHFEGGPV